MSAALLVTAAAVLLLAGLAHLVGFAATVRSVVQQGLVPRRFAAVVVAGLALVECVVGAGTLVSVVLNSPNQRLWAALCVVLLLSLAGYAHQAAARRSDPDALCACGIGEAPLGIWTTLRPLMLAALAAVGGLAAPATQGWLQRPVYEQVILVCAALSLSIAVTLLPPARAALAASNGSGRVR